MKSKFLLVVVGALGMFAQEDIHGVSSTGTLRLVHTPITQREIGGIDDTGKYYVIDAKGNKKRCSRKHLIREVKKADLDYKTKNQALLYLGAPQSVRIYEGGR